ncbi:MAG TPA: MotA/TolQ/ExbB proton channel family protein [Pseudomonadales bacterium]
MKLLSFKSLLLGSAMAVAATGAVAQDFDYDTFSAQLQECSEKGLLENPMVIAMVKQNSGQSASSGKAMFAEGRESSNPMVKQFLDDVDQCQAKLKNGTAVASSQPAASESKPSKAATKSKAVYTRVRLQPAASMDELLTQIENGRVQESRENAAREARFAQNRAEQAGMLKDAVAERQREEARAAKLEEAFNANEKKLAVAEQTLRERLGSLTELFGHITTTSGDLRTIFGTSLVSVQYPNRELFLDDLVKKSSSTNQLPSIEEIERLWFEIQREMVESGKVVEFDSTVTSTNGEPAPKRVVRVGVFNLVSEDGNYLSFDSSKNTVSELPRQPSGGYLAEAKALAQATEGMTRFGIDPTGPTGGSFLSALINSPTLEERWHQGGVVGYIITAIGVLAFIIAFIRVAVLTAVGSKVKAQLKSDTANANNPLGRVLAVYEANPAANAETLELKLSEAVLKEIPKLEYGQTMLKIITGVAPLLGLLGTVTGMIITFQAITIYGAGDPKAMAGGISSALVTTVLGLCVAIPSLLLHTWVAGRSKKIIHILEEQTTGIIAERNEAQQG